MCANETGLAGDAYFKHEDGMNCRLFLLERR